VNVHIVIPSYNNWKMTNELLASLYREEKDNISSVLVIDNGSDTEVNEQIWSSYLFPVDVLRIEVNCGFLLAANQGLKLQIGKVPQNDIVILLSNDVLVKGKFIDQIKSIMGSGTPSLIGGILYTSNTGWNTFGGQPPIQYLEGWLLATTAENWKSLNYFDERFAPNDFEDLDICMTARAIGYELVPLNNVYLRHIGAATLGYNDARLEVTNRNKEKFAKKWNL